MERFLALSEFEPEARRQLAHAVYEYVAGGAGDEHSLLIEELRLAMALVGANSLRDLDRDAEW
jgi:4-hydroxymandelate oxidase